MMGQTAGPRLARGSNISNECPLKVVTKSKLAVDVDLWCRYNSWKVCSQCEVLQPRDLLPKDLGKILSPFCAPGSCTRCGQDNKGPQKRQQYAVPSMALAPEELQNLSASIRSALSPLEPDFGPEIRSRDQFGRPNGYRQHSSMVRFSWHPESVQKRIAKLQVSFRAQSSPQIEVVAKVKNFVRRTII